MNTIILFAMLLVVILILISNRVNRKRSLYLIRRIKRMEINIARLANELSCNRDLTIDETQLNGQPDNVVQLHVPEREV